MVYFYVMWSTFKNSENDLSNFSNFLYFAIFFSFSFEFARSYTPCSDARLVH